VQRLAIRNDSHALNAGKPHRVSKSVLRVVRLRPALLERLRRRRAGRNHCVADTLERCDATNMVKVFVGDSDKTHVFGSKAERPNVLVDEGRRLRQSAIKENVSPVRCNEDRRETCSAYVIRVAKDPKWLAVPVPLVASVTHDRLVRLC
jgi:hypothetical protein